MNGILPPQALEMEEAIIGALLIENCYDEVNDIISSESFYKENHKIIYQAISVLKSENKPVDMLTVVQQLKKTGEIDLVGGAYGISTLTNRVGSSANVEYHSHIIQEKYILRQIITLGMEVSKLAYQSNSDCFDLINILEKKLTEITKGFSSGKIKKLNVLWEEVKQQNTLIINNNGISGVRSGYTNIDKLTGGFQKGSLIIIAARPAMGKTALALNFARNSSVNYKHPCLIFSLEMTALQLSQRLFSIESHVSNNAFTRNGIDNHKMTLIQKDCYNLINSEIYIDDTAAITLVELRSKARKLKREKNIQFIIVDYLQLMAGDKSIKGNREQEISSISRGLKELAKELDLPVLALSQLSRETEKRTDKRPQLSDLRESGAIEQDADMVCFIHRPEYYGIRQYEDGSSTTGIAEVIFAKHRNGAVGCEKLRWIDYLTKFENLEEEAFPQLQNSTSFNENPF